MYTLKPSPMAVIKEFQSNKTQVKCSESVHLISVTAVRHTWPYPCHFLHFLWITLLPCYSQAIPAYVSSVFFFFLVCVCWRSMPSSLPTLQSPLSIASLDFARPLAPGDKHESQACLPVIRRNSFTSCNKHTISY